MDLTFEKTQLLLFTIVSSYLVNFEIKSTLILEFHSKLKKTSSAIKITNQK